MPQVRRFREATDDFCRTKRKLLERFHSTKGLQLPGACLSKVPKLFGPISGATIPFISSQRRGSKPSNFAIFLVFLTLKHVKLKINLQNKRIAVLQLAFRARKVRGTFEKQAPGRNLNVNPLIRWPLTRCCSYCWLGG